MTPEATHLPTTVGPITRDSVMSQAMSLPPADREAIAEMLLLTIERTQDHIDRFPISPAWEVEIERRVEAVKAGDVTGVDPEDFFRRMREKYGK